MTSTNLFFKRIRYELKRSMWAIALGCAVFFFTFPVGCSVILSRMNDESFTRADCIEELVSYMGPENFFVALCTVVAAIICALCQFCYLQSKKKTDFYESMPVSRKELFLVKAASGAAIFLICYWSNIVLSFLALTVRGCMSGNIVNVILLQGFYQFLGFILLYLTVILAIMVTGSMITSLMTTAFLFFAGPVIYLLYRLLMQYFFYSYYSDAELNWHILRSTSLLTPFISLIQTSTNGGHVAWILIEIVITILVLGAINLLVYRNRKAEGAQKAVIIQPVFVGMKFVTVIAGSFGFALLMETITDNSRTGGWFIFGLVAGLILCSVLIEIIQNSDFKCAFAHKTHLVVVTVMVAALYLGFRFDVFGYDSYLPDADKVESFAVDFEGVDTNVNGIDFNASDFEYMSRDDYRLKYMKLTDTDDVLAIVQEGIEYAKQIAFSKREPYDRNVTVKYRLKNGKEVYRCYTCDTVYDMAEFDRIYNQPEYKEGAFPVYRIPEEITSSIYCSREGEGAQLGINQQEIKNLVTTYLEDLKQLKAQEIRDEAPLAQMSFYYPRNRYQSIDVYVYPSFTNTIEMIRAYGFPLSKTMNLGKIKELTIYGVGEMENETYYYRDQAAKEGLQEASATVTDPKMIEMIYPYLLESDSLNGNWALHKTKPGYWVDAEMLSGEYEQKNSINYSITAKELPKEVEEFLCTQMKVK